MDNYISITTSDKIVNGRNINTKKIIESDQEREAEDNGELTLFLVNSVADEEGFAEGCSWRRQSLNNNYSPKSHSSKHVSQRTFVDNDEGGISWVTSNRDPPTFSAGVKEGGKKKKKEASTFSKICSRDTSSRLITEKGSMFNCQEFTLRDFKIVEIAQKIAEHRRKYERKREEREIKERIERVKKAREEHERAQREEEARRQSGAQYGSFPGSRSYGGLPGCGSEPSKYVKIPEQPKGYESH
ncbi:hypothetical protein H8959_007243, partial [Pygathrix nigripes]